MTQGLGVIAVLVLSIGVAGIAVTGCGASTQGGDARAEGGRGGAPSGLAGMSPAGGVAGAAPDCDATKSPSEDACVIDERYGIFVSPFGDDITGDGSRAHPYATLWTGITQAEAQSKRVYACADGGPYRTVVDLDSAANGLEMYGGFSCTDFSYRTFAKSRVFSPVTRALSVEWVYGLRIEDFAFQAAFGSRSGESSVAAVVQASSGVVLRRLELEAGVGMSGADGSLNAFTYEGHAELDGNDATGMAGASEKACQCEWLLPTTGDVGGVVRAPEQHGGAGMPELGPCEERGDAATSCESDAAAQRGADAPAVAGATGATTVGTVTSDGWVPASGEDGATGPAGHGGGGGACTTEGGGGGGGCGSCGGAGGPGGQGGGASIALLVSASVVSIADSKLITRDGGKGGDGVPGQLAQREAGLGGKGIHGGCPGGAGGLGADGAAGGGAAGGVSVGILWAGEAPAQTGLTILIGRPGTKGSGGEPGTNDGIDGIARDVLEAPRT